MKKSRILNLVLIGGLLLPLIALSSCNPATAGGASGIWFLVLMLALVFGMFYFLMVRPMRQRERTHDRMVDELESGDTVITAGGLYGEVESMDEDSLILKVGSGAKIRVTKGGVLKRLEE